MVLGTGTGMGTGTERPSATATPARPARRGRPLPTRGPPRWSIKQPRAHTAMGTAWATTMRTMPGAIVERGGPTRIGPAHLRRAGASPGLPIVFDIGPDLGGT